MITLVCNIFELRKAIKGLRPAFPLTARAKIKLVFELEIRPHLLTLSIPGATSQCTLENDTFAKAFIPYSIFKKVVESCHEDIFTLNIENGKLTTGKTRVLSKRIILAHFENQTKIDLSINYSTLELLSLRYNHSYEEIERRNLYTLLDKAEDKLYDDIQMAARALSDYKVLYSDLEELIETKILKHKT